MNKQTLIGGGIGLAMLALVGLGICKSQTSPPVPPAPTPVVLPTLVPPISAPTAPGVPTRTPTATPTATAPVLPSTGTGSQCANLAGCDGQ